MAIGVLAFAISGAVLANGDAGTCRTDQLSGLYVFSATGYIIVAGVPQPKAIIELIDFHGDGNLTVAGATRSINGIITQVPPGGTGTYTMTESCVGSLTFSGGPSFDIFMAPRGDDMWMIQTNANNVLQGNVTRVSR